MKIMMKKPPLRGYVIGDTVFLQAADWRSVCQYDCIEFHANARSLVSLPEKGESAIGDHFVYRQITSGDALCLKEGSSEEEIAKHILALLKQHWNSLVEEGVLPPLHQCAFPNKVCVRLP